MKVKTFFSKPLGCSKGSPKREVDSNTGLPQETRSLQYTTNTTPKELEKEQQTKPRAYRRREKIKMRAEIKNAEKTKQQNGIMKLRACSS